MDDLILYGRDMKKLAVLTDYIEFNCSAGRKAYSENDFILKTAFDKNNLIELGCWVCYGKTDFGGIIRTRTIDTQTQIVIYEGVTFRGILDSIIFALYSYKAYYSQTSATGTISEIMNKLISYSGLISAFFRQKVEAVSEITDTFSISLITTSNRPLIPLLSEHDKLIRECSTGSTPKKSKFYIDDGKIKIRFAESNTYYYDSTHAFVKYTETKAKPNSSVACFPIYDDGTMDTSSQAYIDEDGNPQWMIEFLDYPWIVDFRNYPLDEVAIITEAEQKPDGTVTYASAIDMLADAQEKPSIELTIDTEEAEIDDVIVASIAELGMKVTKKVVESTLKISNGIPKITYTLEG